MERSLKFHQALHEALDQCLMRDPAVYLMGLGVPDPKGIFGSTLGLLAKHGPSRVMDMPTSENAMTGIAIGSALAGMRPVMTHQRVEFALLAVEQLVNQAAKWHYMFDGEHRLPLVVRMIIGRGWGQGPQHSQSLHSWFAHIPGLKVAMPASPHDAKGLLVAAIEDDGPVVLLEHRWLYNTFGPVPEELYRVPLGAARVARPGRHVTIVAVSHMVIEALRAADHLAAAGVEAEVVDLRSLRPIDRGAIVESVRKTGHLVVCDVSWALAGISAEVLAIAAEDALEALRAPPRRVTLADAPIPSSPALAQYSYPRAADIARTAAVMLGLPALELPDDPPGLHLDVPDDSFTGPF